MKRYMRILLIPISSLLLIVAFWASNCVFAEGVEVPNNLVYLTTVGQGIGIQLHGGWSSEDVGAGYPVAFSLNTNEPVTWTGTHPEAGTFYGLIYETRFRKVGYEVVTAQMSSGEVYTKQVWVSPFADHDEVTSSMSCYRDCVTDSFVQSYGRQHGNWISTTTGTTWTWWLIEDGYGVERYDTQRQPVFAFKLHNTQVRLYMLAQNPAWEDGWNYCTLDNFLAGYYCQNAYGHAVAPHDLVSPAAMQEFVDEMSARGIDLPDGWQNHIFQQ